MGYGRDPELYLYVWKESQHPHLLALRRREREHCRPYRNVLLYSRIRIDALGEMAAGRIPQGHGVQWRSQLSRIWSSRLPRLDLYPTRSKWRVQPLQYPDRFQIGAQQ